MSHRGKGATIAIALGVVALIAVHAGALYYFTSHVAVSATVGALVVLVVAGSHLGWFSALRRDRPPDQPRD